MSDGFPPVAGVEHRFVEACGLRMPNFELIPGAGHFVCDTHANVVADRIRSWL